MRRQYRAQRPSYKVSKQEATIDVIKGAMKKIADSLDILDDHLGEISPDTIILTNALNSIDSSLPTNSLEKQIFDFIEQGLRL